MTHPMNRDAINERFDRLRRFCEKEQYKGWDPYDGLNSRLFQSIPFIRNNRLCRLAWIQFFKRSPINFRVITGVPKEYNSKGMGLFLTGFCNLQKIAENQENLDRINFFAHKILGMVSKGYSGNCWGYNFDWQARAFFQPKFTPTVVATSFIADALWNAYEVTKENTWLEAAHSTSKFVLNDLNRTLDAKNNFSFSYSPLDSTQVFNASLLGARLLSRAYFYSKDTELKLTAEKAVAFVCDRQRPDGSWAYGTLDFHQWTDSFHTGFNLECLHDYSVYTGDKAFDLNKERGLDYYLQNFFTADGKCKYYPNTLNPIDIHSPAQLLVTLFKLGVFEKYQKLAETVLGRTLLDMQDEKGYFYYQIKQRFSSRIPYMRWAQAWMFYALTYYFRAVKP